jgi:hypothetical protein
MKGRLLLALVVVWSWPAPLLAADEATPNALLRKGAELFKGQDYESARAAFARAYELDPKPATLFDLAVSELNSDHPVDAAKHLREYLTHGEEPAGKLESVRTKWLPRADALTARLDVFTPAGAELTVDGIVQERAALVNEPAGQGGGHALIVIAPGEHDVTARQGAVVESQHVVARGGELVEVHFQRLPDATPAATMTWSAGASGQEAREGVESAPSRAKWVTFIALGSGAAIAAVVGVGFGVAAQNKANDVRALRAGLGSASGWTNSECAGASGSAPSCGQLNSDVSANRQDWTISTAAFIGAGVLAGASAAALTLWHTGKPKASSVRVRPVVDARSAGVLLGGEW